MAFYIQSICILIGISPKYSKEYEGFIWKDNAGVPEVFKFNPDGKLEVLRFGGSIKLPPKSASPENTASGKKE